MIVVNSSTRQFNIPGADLVFGVESDSGSEVKNFQCPRYVGDNLDLMGCFVRFNYRNANGDVDSYLVEDMAVDGDNVTFSWRLHPKVTAFKGQVRFVMCAIGPDLKLKWHTTLGAGQVLEGLEPNNSMVVAGTADAIAQLINLVNAQTDAVEAEGSKQIKAVQTAAQTAQSDAVAEIEAKGVNTRNSIPDDYTALSEAVETLNRTKGAAIVCEVAGSAMVVNDASDMAIQGMRIFGRSTQDGTPTPDAPVEIKSVENPVVTVCGKNLLPYPYTHSTMTANGITFTDNGDGSVTVNGTPTKTTFYKLNDLPQFSGKFVVSGCPKGGSYDTYQLSVDKNGVSIVREYGDGVAVECDEADVYSIVLTIRTGATLSNLTFYPQVEVGSKITEYKQGEAPQAIELTHTLPGIPVTSGGNYTDSDGQQWICDEVDLERGVYVQRFKVVTLTGDENWVQDTNYSCTYRVGAGHIAVGGMSTHYHTYVRTEDIGSVSGVYLAYTVNHIITDPRFVNDLAGFKAFLANEHSMGTPVTVIRRLAEPTETPLSETEIAAYRAMHSNYQNTTVLNDAGAHMVVKYAADTKLYIDNKIAALVGG